MYELGYFTVRITFSTYHPPWRQGLHLPDLGFRDLTGCFGLCSPTALAATQPMP